MISLQDLIFHSDQAFCDGVVKVIHSSKLKISDEFDEPKIRPINGFTVDTLSLSGEALRRTGQNLIQELRRSRDGGGGGSRCG